MHLKCPFSAALIRGLAACPNAEEVVRRGGSEFDCRCERHHATCSDLYGRLKAQALPAFGVEDDLTSMPHSVLVKIQCGGMLGVARLVDGAEQQPAAMADLAALIDRALARYGSTADVPYAALEPDITGFRLERRARRG